MCIRPHTKIPESATFDLATHANVEKSNTKKRKNRPFTGPQIKKIGKKHMCILPHTKIRESATDHLPTHANVGKSITKIEKNLLFIWKQKIFWEKAHVYPPSH